MRIRLRPTRMSLATKSRWLFGIAAVLIIGAALLVVFQRLEQLTAQLNIAAGRALARTEVARHVKNMTELDLQREMAGSARDRARSAGGEAVESSATSRAESVPAEDQREGDVQDARPADESMPATMPAAAMMSSETGLIDVEGRLLPPPRLLGIERLRLIPQDSFEAIAFDRFSQRRDRDTFSRLTDTPDQRGQIFFYAEPLRFGASCISCHMPQASVAGGSIDELLGIVAVSIPSQTPALDIVLNRVFLVAGGLFGGLLAIVVLSFVITRLILRPVRVLQETAEKVSAGDLATRADISSGDEFQKLAQTFNRMLLNLKRSRDELQQANRSLDDELLKLSEVNVGLNEANRLKTEFLANVSHELRTPLNSILGFAELLRGTVEKQDARSHRYLSNITTSGLNLLELINDLLDIARIEAGKVELKISDLSLMDLCEGLVVMLRPLAEKKRLQLRTQVSPDVPIVRLDPLRLRQVLYNLLSNAIKFSPDGASVDLIVTRFDESHVRFCVIDRGPGIEPEKQELIFEKFRQLDQSATRQHGGTGLGLAISRELVTLMEGSIGVDSVPGQGASFWVVLPIRIGE